MVAYWSVYGVRTSRVYVWGSTGTSGVAGLP